MGFLNASAADHIFLSIEDEQHSKLVRPLASKPVAVWGHAVPMIETAITVTGTPQVVRIRDFVFHQCTSTNRSGVGCSLCNIQDPAWDKLAPADRTNRKGQRVDFPRRPKYLLPVWSYTDNEVRIVNGGNQVYEEMDQWDTTGRDIRECDWRLWKAGRGKMTKYHSQRQDTTVFTVQIDQALVEARTKDALETFRALPHDEIMKKIQVMSQQEAEAVALRNATQGAPAQQLPPAVVVPGLALPPMPTPTIPGVPALDLLGGLDKQQLEALRAVLYAGAPPAVASTAASVAQNVAPVVQPAPAADPAPVAQSAAPSPGRATLVNECRTLLAEFPEFKGRGLGENMIPFIKSVIGRYDYTDASVPESDLEKLKAALVMRKSAA